ncbi:MAG TPA: drug/metabolite exporter YedA [Ktedonobacteraceae bacterium]|nr:drug/metabolite exporter YedA [Ktedonobacteraceae bacterium]
MEEQTRIGAINEGSTIPPESTGIATAQSSDRLRVALALLTLYLIWGSTYFFIRVAIQSIPPLLMAGIRFLLAGIILYIILRLRGAPAPTRAEWAGSARVGLLLIGGGMGSVAFAEQWVASSVTAFCIATTPLWISLFMGLWGRWPMRAEWLGLVVGFVGVILLNLGSGLWASPLGGVILILSPMCWAFGSAWSHRLVLPKGLMASAAEMLVAGAMLVLFGLLVGERPTGHITASSLLALLYLLLFGSLVAYSAYGYLLNHVRPALATSYAYINPPVAVCLGVVFAGDRITPTGVVGMIVILAGVVLVSLAHQRKTGTASV